MNSLERIMATLAGQPLDRRAIAPVLSLYGARLTDCPLDRYYTDPVAYAAGQSAVWKTFQPDILFSPFDFSAIGAAFGSELHFFADQAPNVCRPAIHSLAEWDKLSHPDPDSHSRILSFREAVRLMAAEHGSRIPIAAVLPAPVDLPALIMGMEPWLEAVLFDPIGARRVMDEIIPFFVRLANALLADGAAFIVLPCAFASPAIVTRDIVATFARPVLEAALSQLRGPVILHHIGAPLLPHLDLLTGLPAAVAFALDHREDLDRARQAVGPDPVLLGGPCGPDLARIDSATVERECLAVLDNRRHDSRFILFTSGADIPLNTPQENIHALRRAVESCGRADG